MGLGGSPAEIWAPWSFGVAECGAAPGRVGAGLGRGQRHNLFFLPLPCLNNPFHPEGGSTRALGPKGSSCAVPWIQENFPSRNVLIVCVGGWRWAGKQNLGTVWTGSGLALFWEEQPAPALFPVGLFSLALVALP